MSNIILLSLLGSIIPLVGGIVFLYNKSFARLLESYSIPFAAGVLITVSMVGLLPEAVHSFGEGAFVVLLITFFSAFVFEQFVCHLHHHDEHDHDVDSSSAFLILIGDTVHNFIDGVAIAVSYFITPGLGLITAISTFLHEVPHEIGDFGLLLKAGWKKKKILLVNIISSLMTVVGAVLVVLIKPANSVTGFLLAIAAGLFLYLGASDFLPSIHMHSKRGKKNMLALVLGVAIMLITLNLIPHGHKDDIVPGEDVIKEQRLEDNHIDYQVTVH